MNTSSALFRFDSSAQGTFQCSGSLHKMQEVYLLHESRVVHAVNSSMSSLCRLASYEMLHHSAAQQTIPAATKPITTSHHPAAS